MALVASFTFGLGTSLLASLRVDSYTILWWAGGQLSVKTLAIRLLATLKLTHRLIDPRGCRVVGLSGVVQALSGCRVVGSVGSVGCCREVDACGPKPFAVGSVRLSGCRVVGWLSGGCQVTAVGLSGQGSKVAATSRRKLWQAVASRGEPWRAVVRCASRGEPWRAVASRGEP